MLLADPPVNESGAAARELEVGGWYVSADRIRRARGGLMPRLEVQIPAPDGACPGTLHVPDGDGHPESWPGVIIFPDAGGARETIRQMGDHLAGLGYVGLVPDIYYRAGAWAPFDVATLFTDARERARLTSLARELTNDRIIADS